MQRLKISIIITIFILLASTFVSASIVEKSNKNLYSPQREDNLDIAVANLNDSCITVLYATKGEYQIRHDFYTGENPNYLIKHDFNNDGLDDLAASIEASDSLGLYLGTEYGGFSNFDSYEVGTNPSKLTMGNFNSDDFIDIAVVNQGSGYHSNDGGIRILLGNSDGNFNVSSFIKYYNPTDVASGDFNNDGVDDLAITSSEDYFSIFLNSNNETNNFTKFTSIDKGISLISTISRDYNNDGLDDLGVLDNLGFKVLYVYITNLSQEDLFNEPFSVSTESISNEDFDISVSGIISDDFDNDGNIDLGLPGGAAFNKINILKGLGNGEFIKNITNQQGDDKIPIHLASEDINNDSIPDLAVVNLYKEFSVGKLTKIYPGGINLFFGDGNATFTQKNSDLLKNNVLGGAILGDFGPAVNENPKIINFNCPTYGEYNEDVDFRVESNDIEGDKVYFEVNWGEDDSIQRTELCSGSTILRHRWKQRGTFTVSVRCIDYNNGKSNWTSQDITIRKTIQDKTINFESFFPNLDVLFRLLKIKNHNFFNL